VAPRGGTRPTSPVGRVPRPGALGSGPAQHLDEVRREQAGLEQERVVPLSEWTVIHITGA